MQACADALADCASTLADLPGLFVVVGHPHQFGERGDVRSNSVSVPRRYNAASVLSGVRVLATYCKRELPNYQVFDERRYFASGRDAAQPPMVIEVQGLRFGIVICEDAWFDEPGQTARAAGAQVLCVLNASPFHLGKLDEREERMARTARGLGMPLLYAHMAGGQDEMIFDGASFALDAEGTVTARAPMFDEALTVVEVSTTTARGEIAPALSREAQAWAALVRRRARLRRQEWFSGCADRFVGRHRLGTRAGGGGRCARCRSGPHGDDAVALHRRHLVARRPRHGRSTRGAPRRDLDRADVRILQAGTRWRIRRPARRHCRRKHPGAHSWHLADGALEQVRPDRADHRQQERDGHRLLHALRRHGRWLRT